MGFDDGGLVIDFSYADPQVADELVEGLELLLGGQVAVEIADQANAEGDVIEKVAMDVAAVDLAGPAAADLDLAVARGCAIADDEMVGEPVGHLADVAMVVVEDTGVALAGAGVVDDDETPAVFGDRGTVDGGADGRRQVMILDLRLAAENLPPVMVGGGGGRDETAFLFKTLFLDIDLGAGGAGRGRGCGRGAGELRIADCGLQIGEWRDCGREAEGLGA